jgi:capsular exopolysaccharide synthesis family protein
VDDETLEQSRLTENTLSRIDEALRQLRVDKPATEIAGQEAFLPAWSVGGRETKSSPAKPGTEQLAAAPGIRETEPRARLDISSAWRERLAIGPDGDPALIEQFRRLAATLHHAHQAQGLRSVMVTSAGPGEGKTLTAINLALVLAESYRYQVLLVDADLRRPSISNVVDLAAGAGLSEGLRSVTPQKLALAQLTPRLTLLPAGGPTMNSIEALVSPRMKLILEEASTKFDWVVLDSPPVGPTADARLLSQMAGGTLFVVRAGKSQHPDVVKAIEAVGRDQILGVVLNDVEAGPSEAYYYAPANTDRDD